MSNKLSSCEPGQIVHGIDLSAYRVTSKIAGPEGVVVKLASLSGEPVSLPADFTPIGPRMTHLASAMFLHLAYNKDLDLYVRACCEQAGLPVPVGPDGQPFRWADWFQKTVAPKLISPIRGEEGDAIKDEAIHEMLSNTLLQRNILKDFKKSIKKRFPEYVQKLPVAKQLTVYLVKNFRWRVEEMNRKIKEQMPPEEVSMMKSIGGPGHGEDEEVNILDTEEYATQPEFGEQTEHDVRKFRDGFYGWLKKHQSETSAKSFITLFDIYWEWVSESTESANEETGRPGYMPARRHLEPLWKEKTQLSSASLYEYIGRLAKLLEQYIQENRHTLGEGDIFVKLIDNIHHEREKLRRRRRPKVKASLASLNLAAADSYCDACDRPEAKCTCDPCHCDKTASMKTARHLISGNELTPEMLQQVKDAFIYRWTSDNPHRTTSYHCDKCDINNPYVNTESSEGHDHPTIPLQTDAQWLSDKAFYFTNAGRLYPGHFEPGILANPVLSNPHGVPHGGDTQPFDEHGNENTGYAGEHTGAVKVLPSKPCPKCQSDNTRVTDDGRMERIGCKDCGQVTLNAKKIALLDEEKLERRFALIKNLIHHGAKPEYKTQWHQMSIKELENLLHNVERAAGWDFEHPSQRRQLASEKTAEFAENVLPPDEAVMCKACGFEEAVKGKEYCEGCLADVEHPVCPRCLECTQCNLRPCRGGGPHMPGVERNEAWRINKEMAQQGKLGTEAKKAMTLDEAKKQQLDVTFLRDAEEAEGYAKSLAAAGREVVAIWNETLPGATEEHWMLACRPAKRVLGSLGLDTRKEGSEDADYESLHPNWEEEEQKKLITDEAAMAAEEKREVQEAEFNKMREYMKSLGWLGMNPWYPEKYPWWGMRIYSDGWKFWKKDLAANKEESVAEGTTLDEMKKYLSRYDLEKLRTGYAEPPKEPKIEGYSEEDKDMLKSMGIKAKKAAESGLGNKELLEATANLLEARRDDMVTVQDWEILQDAFDYASGDEPIPSISIALANLLDTHRMQPPMVTSEQWEEVAKAYEDITGNHIEWRKADELSDEEWEKQYGDGVSLSQAVSDDREEQDQALIDRIESKPEPDKEASIGHEFYDGIRPQITPGDTGRLPHARKEGAAEKCKQCGKEAILNTDGHCRECWFDFPQTDRLESRQFTVKSGAVRISENAASGQERTLAETGGGVEIVPEQSGDDLETVMVDLLQRAAESLQESGEGDMNNPLALEIEETLNEMGHSMYKPKTGSKTAARPEDFVLMFHKWLEKGKRMLEGFVTNDKYLARSVANLHVYLIKMEEELGGQMLAEHESKIGAGPVTPQQMLVKNVQQSQGVKPGEEQQPKPALPAQPGQPAVAITPQSGRGEDAPMRKTILPELANPNFHMSSDEPVGYVEPPAELTQLINTKLRGHRAIIPMSSNDLNPDNAPSDDLWFAVCGQCGAIWSFTNGDLMMRDGGDGSCQVGLPENTTVKTSAPTEQLRSTMGGEEDDIFVDKKGFFESVRTKYR